VRQGVAEIDEQAIAEILRDMPLEAGDHLGTGLLIGPHHRAEIFWVELAGECSRVHQVTKQYSELAAFGFGCLRRDDAVYCGKRRGVLRHGRRRLRHHGARCWEGLRGTRPDQHTSVLIPGDLLRVEEFVLEIIEGLLIQVKLALKRPIRHTLALAQELDNVIEQCIEVHPIFSTHLKVMADSGRTVLYVP
jgi:hypothetical protein